MTDYDPCEECRINGDTYSYDKDGDLVSNCYDCPMRVPLYVGREDAEKA